MTETITVPKVVYDELSRDSEILGALKACGVDNWSGYGEAMEYLESTEDE